MISPLETPERMTASVSLMGPSLTGRLSYPMEHYPQEIAGRLPADGASGHHQKGFCSDDCWTMSSAAERSGRRRGSLP